MHHDDRAALFLLLVAHAIAAALSGTVADHAIRGTGAWLAPIDPASKLFDRMAGLVVPYGYPLEEHFVRTVDGYILRLFRIPHGKADTQAPKPGAAWGRGFNCLLYHWSKQSCSHQKQQQQQQRRPVVHMQHGLLDSSTGFVLNGPGLSLPFLLADAGYDVWLGNVRGNIFSRNHTSLKLLDPNFWAFSWDDMAAKDLPSMLTVELLITGADEISYIGHSQGTTIGMAFLSSHAGHAVAERIKVAVLLAPVAFVTHVDSVPLRALATLDTDQIFTLLGFHEFMPSSEMLSKLEGQLCFIQPALCVNLLAAICGYNPSNLDTRRLPTYLNYTPSGTSVKNMAHWSQAVRQASPSVMRYFDYGTTCRTFLDIPQPCNQAVYGQLFPPMYNLSAIQNKLVLFTGGKDRLSDPVDISLLLDALPTEQVVFRHHEPEYEHLDFIWGTNAAGRIYSKVMQTLRATESS